MKNKLLIIGVAAIILALALMKCDDKPVTDVDRLVATMEAQDRHIREQDAKIATLMSSYDSAVRVNRDLSAKGVRSVVRYKTIRLQGDTVRMLESCDSLATEFAEYVIHTQELVERADTLITGQRVQIDNLRERIKVSDTLIGKLQGKLAESENLAKRRGRAIEW
jgi:hypothetical protein